MIIDSQAPSTEKVLLGQSLAELTQWAIEQGQPAYRGKQLYQYLYQKGVNSLTEITVFPKQWRENLANYPIGRSKINHCRIASDQTRKYLLELKDGNIIETVGIPTQKRLTVCVSSQVGCPMACEFCATGKGGFTRNLEAHEIIDQILTVQNDFQRRVTHGVFMGMGEPLMNLSAVVKALTSLNQDLGISARSLTISTVGIKGKIRQLAQYQLQSTLAVSLHAPNQALREQLIPTATHYPLTELLNECREYVKITKRRITFEYILLANINDNPEQAEELACYLKGFQSHINLIPYNPISDADFRRPRAKRINEFTEVLKKNQIEVTVRYSRGLEADAACGQLRTARGTISLS